MVINVYPGAVTPSHPISLSDGVRTFGLTLAEGEGAIEEVPLKRSTLEYFEGQPRYGDGEPGISHVEQRTWIRGRGQEDFLNDPAGYADGKMAWTLTPGKLFPAPMWQYGTGYLNGIVENMPGDLGWRAMYGSGANRYTAQKLMHSANWTGVNRLQIWVRRIGTPRDMTVGLYPDSLGKPDTNSPYVTAVLSAADVTEYEVSLVTLDVSAAGTLSGTQTWLVAAANSLDSAANRWEIGVDVDGGSGAYLESATWQTADFTLYYRLTSAPTDRKWHFFEYLGALYAVDQKANHGAAEIYINGSRGKRTNSDGASISDSNKSWTVDEWAGAWVRIVRGKGGGQEREILSNTSTTLTVANWDTTLDGTSEYVIYHTPKWTSITPSSGDTFIAPVVTAAVIDDQVHFGFGDYKQVMKMRWNNAATPPAHEFDYDTNANYANHLITVTNEANGTQLYRFRYILGTHCFFARASYAAWGTDFSYGSMVTIGSKSEPINGVCVHGGKLLAFKPDGRYRITPEDKVVKEVGEVGFIKTANNGEALLSHGLYLYLTWGGYALQRLYEGSGNQDMTNIGPDRDDGLPINRRGKISALVGTPPGIVAAVDAGDDGYSSVLMLPEGGLGWHELFRGWDAGKRVQNMHFYDDLRPRLWMSVAGELVYQDWPRHGSNPLKDGGIRYVPEAHLVSSTIDFGAARLPKLVKEIGAACENLSGECAVYLDYQTNADVGTERWTQAGQFQLNPADSLPLELGEVYQIRYRLRLVSGRAEVPPVVNAAVLEGFARTPVKYRWTLRLAVPGDGDPDEFVRWLKAAAFQARRITMRSIWAQMDGKSVAVEPPSSLLAYTNPLTGEWGGEVELRLREI